MKRHGSDGKPRISSEQIAASVITAILQHRLGPGTRLGEAELCAVFQVSRTTVREALIQLSSDGIVCVSPRKGWFVVEPSEKEVGEVFAARRLIESALIREFARVANGEHLSALRNHLEQQRRAIAAEDVPRRVHLLAEFHVRIAEMLGNPLLAGVIRDLTTRSNLASMLYQTNQDVTESADEHELILNAIAAGQKASEAVRLMVKHLHNVEAGLQGRKSRHPVEFLREKLS